MKRLAGLVPGSVVEEWGRRDDGGEGPAVTMIATGVPLAQQNPVFLMSASLDMAGVLARARSFYGRLGLPFRVTAFGEVGLAAAAALGGELGPAARFPGMILSPIEGELVRAPSLSIERVETAEALRAFNDIVAEGFGVDRALMRAFDDASMLGAPGITRYLGSVDGQPAATSMRCITGGVSMILNVVTRPGYGRRGFGDVMTRLAVFDARGEGEACDASFLHSTQIGRPVYERIGYRHVVDIHMWRVER